MNSSLQIATARKDPTLKILEMREALATAAASAAAASQHARDTGNDDVIYFFPRLDGAEMRSRWDMQDAPPDILITNFSMLGIMLMRDADANIFEKTKQWLEEEGSVFHLIIDELHLYRGTAGTEVAHLLKLLLLRLGLTPDSPKLRILASSASLDPDDLDSLDFLSKFFGLQWHSDQIVPGYPAIIPIPPPSSLPIAPFATVGSAATDPVELEAAYNDLAVALGEERGRGLQFALEQPALQMTSRLLTACSEDGIRRAVPLMCFASQLFGNDASNDVIRTAVRGLL